MINEEDVIIAVNAYTNFSCQTREEYNRDLNTTANILYSSQSKTQSNFSLLYEIAKVQLAADESRFDITLSDTERLMALAYIIAYYHERKFKDWNAKSVKYGDDSITRDGSGYLIAYMDVIKTAVNRVTSSSTFDTKIEHHTDYENFPSGLRSSQMRDEEFILDQ